MPSTNFAFTYQFSKDFKFNELSDDVFEYIKPLLTNDAEACLAFFIVRKLQRKDGPFKTNEIREILKTQLQLQFIPENINSLDQSHVKMPKYDGILLKLTQLHITSHFITHQFLLSSAFETLLTATPPYPIIAKKADGPGRNSYFDFSLSLQALYNKIVSAAIDFAKKREQKNENGLEEANVNANESSDSEDANSDENTNDLSPTSSSSTSSQENIEEEGMDQFQKRLYRALRDEEDKEDNYKKNLTAKSANALNIMNSMEWQNSLTKKETHRDDTLNDQSATKRRKMPGGYK